MHAVGKRIVLAVAAVAVAVAMAQPPATAAGAPDFTRIVKNNRDAVVNIATTKKMEQRSAQLPDNMLEQLPPGHPLRRFFKRFGGGGNGSPGGDRTSLGSGFIISSDGYVLTNAHVISSAREIVVKLADNRQFDAKVVGMDKPSDVGLLKIDAENLPTVEIGDSSKLEVGQWLLAIGSPFGLDHTATQGIVSALERNLPNDTYTPFIQTDVAVNPGNSGGPLFNGKGKVVGINSQIFSRTGGYMGLSFAVPINNAMDIVGQLKEDGKVERGYLGVSIQPVDRGLAKSFGLDKPVGALIADVMKDTPAAKSELRAGDVILSVDGQKVVDAADLPPLIGQRDPGETVTLGIVRDGERMEVEVTLGKLSEHRDQGTSPSADEGSDDTALNIAVRELTQSEREKLGLENRGLLVGKVAAGPMAEAGIKPGDILLQLDGEPLKSLKQFERLVQELPRGQPVPVQIRRGENSLFVSVTLPKD